MSLLSSDRKSDQSRSNGSRQPAFPLQALLARRSRCFSRCVKALRRAVKLFVYAWNQRQLYRRKYPQYDAHLIQFTRDGVVVGEEHQHGQWQTGGQIDQHQAVKRIQQPDFEIS